MRLLGSMLSDHPVDRNLVALDPMTNFRRAEEIRRAARAAYFKNQATQAVQSAARARSRPAPKEDIKPGAVVYVWRANSRSNIRGWVGPGLVININEPGTSVWVSMRGVLVKCSREKVRLATDEEWLGAELMQDDMRIKLQRKRNRGYIEHLTMLVRTWNQRSIHNKNRQR